MYCPLSQIFWLSCMIISIVYLGIVESNLSQLKYNCETFKRILFKLLSIIIFIGSGYVYTETYIGMINNMWLMISQYIVLSILSIIVLEKIIINYNIQRKVKLMDKMRFIWKYKFFFLFIIFICVFIRAWFMLNTSIYDVFYLPCVVFIIFATSPLVNFIMVLLLNLYVGNNFENSKKNALKTMKIIDSRYFLVLLFVAILIYLLKWIFILSFFILVPNMDAIMPNAYEKLVCNDEDIEPCFTCWSGMENDDNALWKRFMNSNSPEAGIGSSSIGIRPSQSSQVRPGFPVGPSTQSTGNSPPSNSSRIISNALHNNPFGTGHNTRSNSPILNALPDNGFGIDHFALQDNGLGTDPNLVDNNPRLMPGTYYPPAPEYYLRDGRLSPNMVPTNLIVSNWQDSVDNLDIALEESNFLHTPVEQHQYTTRITRALDAIIRRYQGMQAILVSVHPDIRFATNPTSLTGANTRVAPGTELWSITDRRYNSCMENTWSKIQVVQEEIAYIDKILAKYKINVNTGRRYGTYNPVDHPDHPFNH